MLGHILVTAVNAVAPIVLLILLGYFLRQTGFLTDSFLKTGNALVFHVALPCMLFINVYDISNLDAIAWDIVLYCFACICVLFLLGLVVCVATTSIPERRGVIWQCTFRSNFAIIGLPLSASLGGEEAASVAAVVATVAIPLFNIFGVIALSVFTSGGGGKRPTVKGICRDIVRNPLILAISLGLICLVLRTLQQELWGEPVFTISGNLKFVYSFLSNLKALASPLALLVLGGQFRFSAVKGIFREISVAAVMRIVVAPLLCITGAVLLDRYTGLLCCGTRELPALLTVFGSPVAVSSAIMASEMKNDEQLATQLVVWTSVGSVVTLFLFVCVLMGMGLLWV